MAFNGSYTATTDSSETLFPSARHNVLPSSISSLSASTASRHGSSHISKTYRQASSLFLTRRLPEALSTVLPLITPSNPESPKVLVEPAPVARASRNTRIKIWSLYLTILNAVAELDKNEGKGAFGTDEWRILTAKVRDGDIWEEVVQSGYHGVEGDVDSEVIINLATLLLAHAPNQTINQKRLENYLAACSAPSFDITARMQSTQSPRIAPRYRSPAKGASGADTPRDLNSRIKILELYTLHVLVRNNEWDCAREFISVNPILDEERREAFLQALQSLHDEQETVIMRLAEQEQAERDELEKQNKMQEEKEQKERELAEQQAMDRAQELSADRIERRPSPSGSGSSAKKSKRREGKIPRNSKSSKSGLSKGKNNKPASRPSLASQAVLVLSNLGIAVESIGATLKTNPLLVLRTLGFLLGILLVFGRKDMRQKLARLFGSSWNKVLATAGMGAKVSYI